MMTFRWEYMKAVRKAHKEFAGLAVIPSVDDIETYLHEFGKTAEINGMYKKWIVLRSMLKGKRIFSSICEKDFYKFRIS